MLKDSVGMPEEVPTPGWRGESFRASLAETVRKARKVDLHRHLTGSITAETAIEVARRHALALPTYDRAALHEMLFGARRVDNHKEYFQPWQILRGLFTSLSAVRDILLAVVRDAAADNVVYMELRLSPRSLVGQRMPYDFKEYAEVVANALMEGERLYGTVGRCVVGIPRHVFVETPQRLRGGVFETLLSTMQRYRDYYVGVDLTGDELIASSSEFRIFFEMARAMGFPATIHAGEMGSAEEVEYAVETLHANRIGHGIAAAKSVSAMQLIAQNNCTLEVCPTSNVLLGVVRSSQDLPLKMFDRHRVPYVICTDNPARCVTTLSEELLRVAPVIDCSRDGLRRLASQAVEASFADTATKGRLISVLNSNPEGGD